MPGPECVTPGCRGVVLIDDLCAKCYNAERTAESRPKDRKTRGPRNKPKGDCTWPGCTKPLFAKGLCAGHYKRQRTGKDMDAPIRDSRAEIDKSHPLGNIRSRPGRDNLAKRVERKCISCPTLFMSEGPHHRMCSQCRQRSDEGVSEYNVMDGW